MNLELNNRVAVVTGGSSGIGLATVDMLLAEGMKVAFCGRSQSKLDDTLAQMQAKYPLCQLLAVQCDVLSDSEVQGFANKVSERFGSLDVLVNNAGGARLSTFASTTDDDWAAELSLKFNSVIFPIRSFLAMLEKSPVASIVVTNSLLALQPEQQMVATSAARAGLLNLVHSLSSEFAPKGIRVNSILLGTVESGQWRKRYEQREPDDKTYEQWLAGLATEKKIPLGRFGRPKEAAQAIVFLVSSASSYTTGSCLDVSGGKARHI